MPTSDDNHTPLYKEQTSLALENFQISGTPMPSEFIHALALITVSYTHLTLPTNREV